VWRWLFRSRRDIRRFGIQFSARFHRTSPKPNSRVHPQIADTNSISATNLSDVILQPSGQTGRRVLHHPLPWRRRLPLGEGSREHRRDSVCSIQHVGIAFRMIRPSQGELAASPFINSLPATAPDTCEADHMWLISDLYERQSRLSGRTRSGSAAYVQVMGTRARWGAHISSDVTRTHQTRWSAKPATN
jgi:hypothetical protein